MLRTIHPEQSTVKESEARKHLPPPLLQTCSSFFDFHAKILFRNSALKILQLHQTGSNTFNTHNMKAFSSEWMQKGGKNEGEKSKLFLWHFLTPLIN